MSTSANDSAGSQVTQPHESHKVENLSADAQIQEYLDHGWALCLIKPGSKGPHTKGWNTKEKAIQSVEEVPDSWGVGLQHTWSKTCAIDLDNLAKATEWLSSRGINLTVLLTDTKAVRIHSGVPNRAKLLYRVPEGTDPASLITRQLPEVGIEFRCTAQSGLSVQDVLPPSIHPDMGWPYTWIGDWKNLPVLPDAILALWRRLQDAEPSGKAKTQGVADDAVLEALEARGMVWGREGATGKVFIECPWRDEHTDGKNGEKDAVYWPPHTGGHASGNFHCFHAHCSDRNISHLREFLAVEEDLLPEFEAGLKARGIPMDAEPEARKEGEPEKKPKKPLVPSWSALASTKEERANAKLAPRCLVQEYLYADVAQIVAPGGTGKTTLLLYEAVHIALGRPLWGLDVETSGKVLFVTAEDNRERLLARQREIMVSLALTEEEQEEAWDKVRFWDVSGEKKNLITVIERNIELTTLADGIIKEFRSDPPVLVIFDPMVSFGASENLVNDNEQGLVLAARRIVKGLGCCVRYVHHTGKANAREKTRDGYTGRGGSALPDGSRMTAVLTVWDEGDSDKPPPELRIEADTSVLRLDRPKVSYARPKLPSIWIARDGYAFRHMAAEKSTAEDAQRAKAQLDRAKEETAEKLILEAVTKEPGIVRRTLRTCAGVAPTAADKLIDALVEEGALSEELTAKRGKETKTYKLI